MATNQQQQNEKEQEKNSSALFQKIDLLSSSKKEDISTTEAKSNMSSTKNTKGNRQVVLATYTTQSLFEIPKGLDLEDKSVVEGYGIKWNELIIEFVNGKSKTIYPTWDACESDFKRPDDFRITSVKDVCYEYDEEEEEDEKYICKICCDYDKEEVGIATGENGVEMIVCKSCDVDGDNYNGWGDKEESESESEEEEEDEEEEEEESESIIKNTCDKCNGRTKNTIIDCANERFYCACCDNELYGIVFGNDKNIFENHSPFTKIEIEDWTAENKDEEESEHSCYGCEFEGKEDCFMIDDNGYMYCYSCVYLGKGKFSKERAEEGCKHYEKVWCIESDSEEKKEKEKEVCEKCFLIECCCEAYRLRVLADEAKTRAEGFIQINGCWIKRDKIKPKNKCKVCEKAPINCLCDNYDCSYMGCPNKATHYQVLDDPTCSDTNDGKDWYCYECFKDCVSEEEEEEEKEEEIFNCDECNINLLHDKNGILECVRMYKNNKDIDYCKECYFKLYEEDH